MMQYCGMQTDMMLEKKLGIVHLDLQTIGSGLGQWKWLEHMRPQSPPSQWYISSNKDWPTVKKLHLQIVPLLMRWQLREGELSFPGMSLLISYQKQNGLPWIHINRRNMKWIQQLIFKYVCVQTYKYIFNNNNKRKTTSLRQSKWGHLASFVWGQEPPCKSRHGDFLLVLNYQP